MDFKKITPYLIALAIFFAASAWYFSPALQGKKVEQFDISNYIGASKEVKDYREANGEEPLWTGRMFSGMPNYFISFVSEGNLIANLDQVFKLFIVHPIGTFFLVDVGLFYFVKGNGGKPLVGNCRGAVVWF